MRNLLRTLVLAAASLSIASAANLFTNASFELPDIGGPGSIATFGPGTGITGWTVTDSGGCGGNCIAILDTAYAEPSALFQSHSGQQALDVTGFGNLEFGGIEQIVATTVSEDYELTFWLGNQDNAHVNYSFNSTLHVYINGTFAQSFTNAVSTSGQVNWALQSYTFTATTPATTVSFRNVSGVNDNYLGLDDVSIDVVGGSAVPEPSTWGMMILAGGSLIALRRRK